MSKIKKFSMTLLSAFICFASVFIFAGCKDDKEYSKLYVFSTEGGSVQVNDETKLVEFGDEGSRIFSFEEESVVHLKAIPDEGYSFVKWEYSDDLDEQGSIFSSNAEIDLIMDEDIISIKAIFEVTETNTYSVSYNSGAGYSITPEVGSNASVEEGGSFSFRVGVLEGYDDTTLSVKVNGVNIVAVDGVYTITDIAENKTITVGVSKYKYSVTLNNGTGYTIVPEANQLTNNIEHGTTFSFKVELDEKYNNSEFVVKATGECSATPLTADSNGVYSLIINQDYIITVEGVEVDTYVVTLPSVSYVNVTPIQAEVVDNKVELEEGESLSFTISSTNPELDLSNMIVSVNDGTSTTTLTDNEGVYTISNISRNVSITISNIGVTTYSVTESDDKFSIDITGSKTEFTKGEDVSFTITLATGYKKGTEFKVFADGNELTDVEGVYTIENIAKDIEITTTGIEIITSEVSLPATNDMYSIELEEGYNTTVQYGEDFKFKVVIKTGYVAGDNFVVKAGTTPLVADNEGVYTIDNIIADITISVEDVIDGIHEVSIPTSEMFEIKAENGYTTTIDHKNNFAFTLDVKAGYIKGSNFVVKANGAEVTDVDGIYTITNITEDVEISVEGVVSSVLVTFVQPVNSEVAQILYNDSILASVNIEKNSSLEFVVKVLSKYENVTINSNGLSAIKGAVDKDGDYSYISYSIAEVGQATSISLAIQITCEKIFDYTNDDIGGVGMTAQEFIDTGINIISLDFDLANISSDEDGTNIVVATDGNEDITNLAELINELNVVATEIVGNYIGAFVDENGNVLLEINYDEEYNFTITINSTNIYEGENIILILKEDSN